MKKLGNIITELRRLKGMTQEDLAEKSNLNIRTIQRIESNQTSPRNETLTLLGQALEKDLNSFVRRDRDNSLFTLVDRILNIIFLLLINLMVMGLIGYLTLDSGATFHSRGAAVLLSFFIPFFIVVYTCGLNKVARVIKFGSGMLTYFFLVLWLHGFVLGYLTFLFPCIAIFLATLFYGGKLVNN